MGHFDQSPVTSPSVGYLFGQETFTRIDRNGRNAPIPAIHADLRDKLGGDGLG